MITENPRAGQHPVVQYMEYTESKWKVKEWGRRNSWRKCMGAQKPREEGSLGRDLPEDTSLPPLCRHTPWCRMTSEGTRCRAPAPSLPACCDAGLQRVSIWPETLFCVLIFKSKNSFHQNMIQVEVVQVETMNVFKTVTISVTFVVLAQRFWNQAGVTEERTESIPQDQGDASTFHLSPHSASGPAHLTQERMAAYSPLPRSSLRGERELSSPPGRTGPPWAGASGWSALICVEHSVWVN